MDFLDHVNWRFAWIAINSWNFQGYKMDDLLTSYISLMLTTMSKQKTLRRHWSIYETKLEGDASFFYLSAGNYIMLVTCQGCKLLQELATNSVCHCLPGINTEEVIECVSNTYTNFAYFPWCLIFSYLCLLIYFCKFEHDRLYALMLISTVRHCL